MRRATVFCIGLLLAAVRLAAPAHAEAPPAGALPSLPDDAGPTLVRVATINMWGIPQVSTHIDARFAALADRLKASDLHVVGLQEVWATGPRLRLRAALADDFPFQVDFQSDTGGSGLVILSRFPIAEHHFTAFPVNGKPWKLQHMDWWGRKGIGMARVETPGGAFWFGTTHLHARYFPRVPDGNGMEDQYGVDRWHQVHTVRHTVATRAADEAAIVVGDFNFIRTSVFYALLSGRLPEPHDPYVPWADAGAHGGDGRIDLMWVRPGATATWRVVDPPHLIFADPVSVKGDTPQPLTDHPALAATFVSAVARAGPRLSNDHRPPPGPDALVPNGRAAWGVLYDAGETGEVLLMFGVSVVLFLAGGVTLPRGPGPRFSVRRIARGIVGAGLILLSFGIAGVTLRVVPVRAAAHAFWRVSAPANTSGSAEPAPVPPVE